MYPMNPVIAVQSLVCKLPAIKIVMQVMFQAIPQPQNSKTVNR
jgi:hypothetical protein